MPENQKSTTKNIIHNRRIIVNKGIFGVHSEIGKLRSVIIHRPGPEIENMTPENAERALYSDILNLTEAQKEYASFEKILSSLTTTWEVRSLLQDILDDNAVKKQLISAVVQLELSGDMAYAAELYAMDGAELARGLIEGVVMKKNSLTRYLSEERYILRPLHNFFFTRDASMVIGDSVLIGKMANAVRDREAVIMNHIFRFHPQFGVRTLCVEEDKKFTLSREDYHIEGGDLLVVSDTVLLVGMGMRTTASAIDFLASRFGANSDELHYIIVQELPDERESFIHLDMIFTLLDHDVCMVYEPVVTHPNSLKTMKLSVRNGEITAISEEHTILTALAGIGINMRPISCGGTADVWVQKREQWHSGANFFAFEPGKVLGYRRNVNTLEELNRNGFEILKANDVLKGKKYPTDYDRCVITIEGSELSRGGGGCRCMTMPVARD